MTASASSYGDEAVRAFFNRFVRKAVVDDVVHRNSAPAMDCGIKIFLRAQRSDDQRHFPFFTGRHVLIQTIIGLVDNLVHRKRSCWLVGIVPVPCRQFFGNLVHPLIKQGLWPRVEGREGADDTRLTLCNDQFGARYNEKRRTDKWQTKIIEYGW